MFKNLQIVFGFNVVYTIYQKVDCCMDNFLEVLEVDLLAKLRHVFYNFGSFSYRFFFSTNSLLKVISVLFRKLFVPTSRVFFREFQ